MKFLHLSDLHLGKRLGEFPLLEDQSHILAQILQITERERPDAVLIAGDVYDKSVPPVEAVELFDSFLTRLSALCQSFIISGNHDSPERVAFGGRLMEKSGVHLSPVYKGELAPVTLEDRFGLADVYMLPFVKPVHVRRFHPEEPQPEEFHPEELHPGNEAGAYTQALRTALKGLPLHPERRNILLTHQFVTGGLRSESEELSVGGSDNVDASVFDGFDYVALGHLHRPQNVSPGIRYCGTPLAYAFSEITPEKSVTVVQMEEKGTLSLRTVSLSPLRALAELRGSYQELTSLSFYQNTPYPESYVHITLTDELDIPDAVGKLRSIYKYLTRLDYDNARTRSGEGAVLPEAMEEKSPLGLFEDFYLLQNHQPMSEEQSAFMQTLIEAVWEARI